MTLSVSVMLCAALGGVELCAQGTGSNIISGRVTGPDGRPVEVEVKLLAVTRSIVNSTYSNSNGDFTFQGVGDGVYYVAVESDLYQPAEVQTRVEESVSPQAHILIPLVARLTTKNQAPKGFGNSPDKVSLQELLARFPKRAIKAYEKGNARMAKGDREGAIRNYQKALALAPEMYPALNNLGNARLRGREMSQAETAFRQALALDPGDAEPYINLGHLFFETRQYAAAEKYLRQGLSLSPDSSQGLFFLGATYLRLGNWRGAESNLRRSLEQNDPALAVAHLELAMLYMKTQRTESARKELEAFLKEQPHAPQAAQVRQMLTRLKNPASPPN